MIPGIIISLIFSEQRKLAFRATPLQNQLAGAVEALNNGTRVAEATAVRWADLQLTSPRQVRLHGKGRKERLLPPWRETADALHHLRGSTKSADHQHVFVNRHGQPLTRDGIAYILRKHVSELVKERPTLAKKHITPHVLRHYVALRTMSRAF
jgi:integrase